MTEQEKLYKQLFDSGYQCGIEDAQPKWISVKDRLPEENKLYLCVRTSAPKIWLETFDPKERKFGGWWDYEPNGQYHKKYRFLEAEGITHWMPLPEPPKGE